MRRPTAVLIAAVLAPVMAVGVAQADPATPTPTPGPVAGLTVDGTNSPFRGAEWLGQSGHDHYTVTMQAPIDLPGTWTLTDNGQGLVTQHVDAGTDQFRWQWYPDEGTQQLVSTFHPDCAAGQPCPADFTAAGTYVVMEYYPGPTPTPTPVPSLTPQPPTPSPGPSPEPTATPTPPVLTGTLSGFLQNLLAWLLRQLHLPTF